MEDSRKYAYQLAASLAVGLLIVIVTISLVTAKLGPRLDRRDELRELEDLREERLEQRQEREEERQELLEERREG